MGGLKRVLVNFIIFWWGLVYLLFEGFFVECERYLGIVFLGVGGYGVW